MLINKKTTKIIASTFIATIILTTITTKASSWTNSFIDSNILPKVNINDDYYLNINRDWHLSATPNEVRSSYTEREQEIKKFLISKLQSNNPKSLEEKAAKHFYSQLVKKENNITLTNTSIIKELQDINNIRTIKDLSNFLLRTDISADGLFTYSYTINFYDHNDKIILLSPAPLLLYEEQYYDNVNNEYNNILDVLKESLKYYGYSDENTSSIINDALNTEKEIIENMDHDHNELYYEINRIGYFNLEIKEIKELSKSIPIQKRYIDCLNNKNIKFGYADSSWFKKILSIYNTKNLQKIKNLLICQTIINSIEYVDNNTKAFNAKYNSILFPEEEYIYDDNYIYDECLFRLKFLLSKIYCDTYFNKDVKNKIIELADNIKKAYINRIINCKYLTDTSKSLMAKKVQLINYEIGCPNNWTKYNLNQFSKTLLKSKSLYDSIRIIRQYTGNIQFNVFCNNIDNLCWYYQSPLEVNGWYMYIDNTLLIPIGLLGGNFYQDNFTIEQSLGGIGSIIAHEFSHAFSDEYSYNIDYNGIYRNIYSNTETNNIEKIHNEINIYLQELSKNNTYINFTDGYKELGPDIDGMHTIMGVASTIPDFNYKSCFKQFTIVKRSECDESYAEWQCLNAAHPPAYIRTNVTLQQLDEFYQTYNIKENDNMYLPENKRMHIW